MLFLRSIHRARKLRSLVVLQRKASLCGGRVRLQQGQFFGFTPKVPLEALRFASPVTLILARSSLPYRRWIIRMTAKCSRQSTAQSQFLSGLNTFQKSWHWDNGARCSYRVAHIARAQQALQNSSKTSLRIGNDGSMNMQFLVSSPLAQGGTSEAFISFRVHHVYRSLTAIDA
jgi:Repair protein Rad1/Rec1/Rad17